MGAQGTVAKRGGAGRRAAVSFGWREGQVIEASAAQDAEAETRRSERGAGPAGRAVVRMARRTGDRGERGAGLSRRYPRRQWNWPERAAGGRVARAHGRRRTGRRGRARRADGCLIGHVLKACRGERGGGEKPWRRTGERARARRGAAPASAELRTRRARSVGTRSGRARSVGTRRRARRARCVGGERGERDTGIETSEASAEPRTRASEASAEPRTSAVPRQGSEASAEPGDEQGERRAADTSEASRMQASAEPPTSQASGSAGTPEASERRSVGTPRRARRARSVGARRARRARGERRDAETSEASAERRDAEASERRSVGTPRRARRARSVGARRARRSGGVLQDMREGACPEAHALRRRSTSCTSCRCRTGRGRCGRSIFRAASLRP
jgi:hypothetical protein